MAEKSVTVRSSEPLYIEDRVSIWMSILFVALHVFYYVAIGVFGLKGVPVHQWTWAVIPVLDMLYIAAQAFCLIISGARSNEFGIADIVVSWAGSLVMVILTCWCVFSTMIDLSVYQWMVLGCGLAAATTETLLTQFGRMAFSRRTIGLS